VSGVWSIQENEDEANKAAPGEVATGKRIAVKQLDWDSITAVDLLALFQSFCSKGSMVIEKIEVH